MITTQAELAGILQRKPVRELLEQFGVTHFGEMSARALADAILEARGTGEPASGGEPAPEDLKLSYLSDRPGNDDVIDAVYRALGGQGTVTWITDTISGKRVAAIVPVHMAMQAAEGETEAAANYTHPDVFARGVTDGWAETETLPWRIDWPARQAAALIPFEVVDGRPVNPCEKTRVRHGRNEMGFWGENKMADALVTVTVGGIRHLLMVERDDGYGWAVPGGHAEPGETLPETALRELREETGLDMPRAAAKAQPPRYVPDPRSSDEAWAVTVPVHIDLGERKDLPVLRSGDEARRAEWVAAGSWGALVNTLAERYGGTVFTAHVGMLQDFLPAPDPGLLRQLASAEGITVTTVPGMSWWRRKAGAAVPAIQLTAGNALRVVDWLRASGVHARYSGERLSFGGSRGSYCVPPGWWVALFPDGAESWEEGHWRNVWGPTTEDGQRPGLLVLREDEVAKMTQPGNGRVLAAIKDLTLLGRAAGITVEVQAYGSLYSEQAPGR